MLTKHISITFWNMIKDAKSEWFNSTEGDFLCSKMIKMIEEKEGKEEAAIFEGLVLSCKLVNV